MLRTLTYRRLDHQDGRVQLKHTQLTRADVGAPARVVIAPKAVGVCRSDLREITGTRFLRQDFGHEIVAEVVACEPEGLFACGQLVVLDPHPEVTRTSGFADLVDIQGAIDALVRALVPLPVGMDVLRSVFTEPLACACHCLARLDEVTAQLQADPHSPVGIVGAGMAGTLMAGALRPDTPVDLINRGSERLTFLERQGALPREILHTSEEARDLRFSRVIVATAATDDAVLDLAAQLVEPGGLVVLYAGTAPGTTFAGVDIDVVRRREHLAVVRTATQHFHLAGSHGATSTDFAQALQILTARTEEHFTLPSMLDRLVTRTVPLDGGAELLNELAYQPFHGKPIILPRGLTHTEAGAATS